MSVRAYFNEAKIKKLPSFTSKRYPDNSGDDMRVMNQQLLREGDRLYMMLGDHETIPGGLEDACEEVTLHEFFPMLAKRETGIYRHKSAEAELDEQHMGGKNRIDYAFSASAKNIGDAKELLRLVRAGGIRPSESYETPQGGMSRKDLEAEVERLRRVTRIADKDYVELRSLNTGLNELAEELRTSWWPLCSKRGMRARLFTIRDTAHDSRT
ncbi:MAG: hypothetical protein LiPW15_769 [Parcubacteria group bacterium LiPW_15]|nr:MAG: hypothetical protein LiPW15_769 [Parcubacteria group bacterium LiPW_15]